MSDIETIARRRRLAEEELIRRGVLKARRFPPGLRLVMRLMPRLKAPYYGDHGTYGLILAVLFGLPMTLFICIPVWLSDEVPLSFGLLLGFGSGALFGLLFTGWMKRVHDRMDLTPWEHLEDGITEARPGDRQALDTMEAGMIRSPFRGGLGGHLGDKDD